MKAIQRAGFWAFIVAIFTPFAFILSVVGGGAYPTPEKTYLYLAFIVYLAIIGLRLNQLKGPIVAILIINIILGLGFLGGIFPLLLVIMSIVALAKVRPYLKWRKSAQSKTEYKGVSQFIRNTATNSWRRELDDFVATYKGLPRHKQADYFIFSVRTRAGMQVEGHFTYPDGTVNAEVELSAYPIMLKQFERIAKLFHEKNAETEAASITIWVHTLRAFLYPELRPSVEQLWDTIIKTKDLWPEMIKHHRSLDKEILDPEVFKSTYELVAEILKTLPPKITGS